MVHKKNHFYFDRRNAVAYSAAGAAAPVPVAASELLPEAVSKAAAVPEPILAPVALSVALAELEPVYAAREDPYFANEAYRKLSRTPKTVTGCTGLLSFLLK